MLDLEDLDFAFLGLGIENRVRGREGLEVVEGFLFFFCEGLGIFGGLEGGLDGRVLREDGGPAAY